MYRKILKYVIYTGLFGICLVPLVIADGSSPLGLFFPGLIFPFITGKVFLFRIIVEVIFSAWLLLIFYDRTYFPKKSFILFAALGFLGIITLADFLGVDSSRSVWSNFERMEGLVTHIHLFLFFLVASAMLSSQKLWNRFFHTNIAVSVFMVFYSLLAIGGELAIRQGGVRVDGTLGNATYLAVYFLFTVFFLIFFCYSNLSKVKEILYTFILGTGGFLLWYLMHLGMESGKGGKVGGLLSLTALIICGGAWYLLNLNKRKALPEYIKVGAYSFLIAAEAIILLYTATRGVILAGVAGLFFLSLTLLIREKKNTTLRKTSIGVIALLILLGGIFIGAKNTEFVKQSEVLSRFQSLNSESLATFFTQGEGKSRYLNGKAVLQGLKERPLLGFGQENFNYVFYRYYDPAMYDQEPWFDRAHNVIFDWLAAGGILGLLAYLSMYGAAFYYLLKPPKEKEDPIGHTGRAVFLALLGAYFLQNLTVFDNITSYIFFFTVLAYLHFLYGKSEPLLKDKNAKLQTKTGGKVLVPIVVLCFVVSLYFINIKPILASKNAIVALSIPKTALERKLEYFEKALSYSSQGTDEIRELLGRVTSEILRMDADPEIKKAFFTFTEAEYKKQIEKAPFDVRYYYFLGALYSDNKQYDQAVSYLEKARELSPKKQTTLLELGATYMSQADYKKGNAVFKETYELAPNFNKAKNLYALSFIYLQEEKLAIDLLGEEYGKILENDIQFARAFEIIGDYKRAILLWKKWILKEPNTLDYRTHLIVVYLKDRNRAGAIQETKKAMEHFPDFKEQGELLIKQIQEGRTIQ